MGGNISGVRGNYFLVDARRDVKLEEKCGGRRGKGVELENFLYLCRLNMKDFLGSNSCKIGLSPMDDVTDAPFREMCKEMGADVLYTEFVSAEGLNHDAMKSKRKMRFEEWERPIGVQIFGADEAELVKCLTAVESVEPDFVDINWGCPVRKVAGKGAGSGMLRDVEKLVRITESIVRHAKVPVTVKTRIGYDAESVCIGPLVRELQAVGVAMVAIHGRTKTQMYGGEANWEAIGAVKADREVRIPIYGNGDIVEAREVKAVREKWGVDGVLIGRGAIGNPWIFEQSKRVMAGKEERVIEVAERVEVCRRHIRRAVEFYGEHTGLIVMKRHYGGYFKGLHNFKQFKALLMNGKCLEETERVMGMIEEYYK